MCATGILLSIAFVGDKEAMALAVTAAAMLVAAALTAALGCCNSMEGQECQTFKIKYLACLKLPGQIANTRPNVGSKS